MNTKVSQVVSAEDEDTQRAIIRHDTSEENDGEAKHKCQLCKQSFVERQTLDEHVELCDLFDESKDTFKNLKSRIKKCTNKEMHNDSSKEKDSKYWNGKSFYVVLDIEEIKAQLAKDNGCDDQMQVISKGKESEVDNDVKPESEKLVLKKNTARGEDVKTDIKQSVKHTKTDLENPMVDGINVSKSGRKRKMKSFDGFEIDLSYIQRSSRRKLQSLDNPTLSITTESKLEGDKIELGNESDGKAGACLDLGDSGNKTPVTFLCPLCTEEDRDLGSIQSHLKLKHDQKQLSWANLQSGENRKTEDPAIRVAKGEKVCPFCKKSFQTIELLKHHVNSKHAGLPYCCGICCRAYASRKAAILHMKKSHLKLQLACIDCNKEFTTSKDLKKHNMKLHRKQMQDINNKKIERKECKLSADYQIDDNLCTSNNTTSRRLKTQELEKEKTAEVIICKTGESNDVSKQTVALKKESIRSSGQIIIKSARVIPKKDTRDSKEIVDDETEVNQDEIFLIDNNKNLSDTDEEIEDMKISSVHENTPYEEHGDKIDLSIKPKGRLDFSKLKDVKYKCCFEYCGSILQNFSYWKKHIFSHLTYKKKEYKYAPLQCIECGYSSKLKPVFIQHLLTKHSRLGSVEINLEYCQILDQKTLKPVQVTACVFCCLAMDSRHFLAQHKCYRKKVHFYCPFCEKKDVMFENLQEHIKEDHSDKTIHRQVLGEKFQSLRTAPHDPAYSINNTDTACSTCKQEFKTNDELKLHVNEIHAMEPFSCGVCRQCYGRYCAVKDHMKKTHSLPMACQHCKRAFGDKADLARHEATHLKTKPFKCDICSATFADRKGLSAHYRFKHTTHSDGKTVENSGIKSKPDTFICDICGLILYSNLQYKNHAKNHKVVNQDNGAQISCEICSKMFTSRTTYRRHLCMKAVNGSDPVTVQGRSDSVQSVKDIFEQIKLNPTPGTNAVVKCGLCLKDFNKNKYLFNHIRHVHLPNEGKKFHCSICGSGFSRKAQLQCHMRSHRKTNPYLCKICGKRFRQLGHVKVHLLSHSTQSLFNCELCAQVFKTKSGLKTHITRHCDIYPYKCFVISCHRSFVSLNNLLLHVRNCDDNLLQEKAFECKLCSNKKLDDLKSGLAHMKSHSKDAFYKCSMCYNEFITYRALYEHKAKLKHFTRSEKENAGKQTIHTQNFKSIEVDNSIDTARLQEQYEFTPDPYESEEIIKEASIEPSEQAEIEGEEEDKVIDSEELMDIAEQLTHMAQRNILHDENLEVKTYPNDNNYVVESVETVIEDYSEELFAAAAVDMSVPTSKYNNQYNELSGYDESNMLNATLTNNQHKSPRRNDNTRETPKLNFVQKDDVRDLTLEDRHDSLRGEFDNQIEVLASHPVIDENAVLVSRTSQRKKRLINDYNTEIVREDDRMFEAHAEVNNEIKPEADAVCIEMLTIPTIYDKFGREVKVNVVNEEGHEIPFQSNQELLQALLTTGNYSLGYNRSDGVTNELTDDTSSIIKGCQETIPNIDYVQKTENNIDLDSSQNNTEIYVINEVQRTEDEIHLDATNKMFTSSRKAKKQKRNMSSAERNIDNVPGEIIDKDATVGRSKADNGNINYKVKLNYYEDRTKNEDVYYLKCNVCPRRFSKLKDLNHHKKIHLPNDEKQFKCKECGKGYVSRNTFRSHMLSHSGDRPHKCNQCDKSFRQLGHLQIHLRIHTNYRPFKCTNCEKTFVTNSQLKAHVKKHGMHSKQGSGKFFVACLVCGNSFASEKQLNTHKIKHISVEAQNKLINKYNALDQKMEKVTLEKSTSKEHMCDVCGQMFNQLSNLKDHKEIHQPESKQTCGKCGNEFLTKKRLQMHVKQAHSSVERWQCDTCGQSFRLKTSFNSHVRHLHKEPKYQCKKCNKEFHRRCIFLQHIPFCFGDEILQPVQ